MNDDNVNIDIDKQLSNFDTKNLLEAQTIIIICILKTNIALTLKRNYGIAKWRQIK